MMHLLTRFAALSLAGSVLLSVLPEGGIKRTAALAAGLLTLLCWLEGVRQLLNLPLSAEVPASILSPTSISLQSAADQAAAALQEVTP